MPPKPKEFEIILFTDFEIDEWGMRLTLVLVSRLSRLRVGGNIFVCKDLRENIA